MQYRKLEARRIWNRVLVLARPGGGGDAHIGALASLPKPRKIDGLRRCVCGGDTVVVVVVVVNCDVVCILHATTHRQQPQDKPKPARQRKDQRSSWKRAEFIKIGRRQRGVGLQRMQRLFSLDGSVAMPSPVSTPIHTPRSAKFRRAKRASDRIIIADESAAARGHVQRHVPSALTHAHHAAICRRRRCLNVYYDANIRIGDPNFQ